MKNMEINKKLGFKVVAVLTSASMILGGLAGCGKEAAEDTDTAVIEQSAEADENDDLLSNVMNQVAHRSATAGTEPRKDEVVYVMADAQGNTQKIIVSDCLKNANGESTITDASSLTDIQNVKGNESYTVDADGNLVWNADGSDIYYQGTTDKELPVDVAISYELEGKEIAPEDLVGKTGNVTIRFTYTNNEKTTVEVNGKEKEVYVPFAMISGAILPAEHFSDIEVTNGKVISEGDNNIVVGMAFPGLKDSVNIDSLKDKAVDEEAKEKLDEVEIPETVEIHAYATNFEMNQTMTMAMSDLLSDLNMDDTLDIDTSKITDSMNDLKDATQQLKDGSIELNDGAAALQEGAQTLADKSKDLDSGAKELVNGISTLNNGAAELNNGAAELNNGAGELNNGAGSLKDGIDQVNSGAESLANGASSLDSGVQTLKNGTVSLVSGAGELNSGAAQLQAGINKASAGVDNIKSAFDKSSSYAAADPKTWGLVLLNQKTLETAQQLAVSLSANLSSLNTQVNEMQAEVQSMGQQLSEAKASVGELGNVPSRGASYDEIAGYYANVAASSQESSDSYSGKSSSDSSSSDSSSSDSSSDDSSSDEGESNAGSSGEESSYEDSSNESTDFSNENVSGGEDEGNTSNAESTEESASSESASDDGDDEAVAVQSYSYEESTPVVVAFEESHEEASEESYHESDSSENSYEEESNDMESRTVNSTSDAGTGNTETESGTNASYEQEEPWNDNSTGSSYEGSVPSRGASYDEIAEYYYKLGQMNAYENVENMLPQTTVQAMNEDTIAVYDGSSNANTAQIQSAQDDLKKIIAYSMIMQNYMSTVYDGLTQLQAGEAKDQGKGGFVALKAGAAALAQGTESAVSGAKQLNEGAGQLAGGTSQLLAGTNTLKDGTSQLLAGAQTLKDGTQSLKDGTQTLKDGTQTLQDGTLELLKGGQTLKDGTSQFVDGTAELNDGAIQLLDGTGELMDGLFTFDEEGISKLTDLFGDNVQDVIDELKAVCDAGRGYKIYSDSASDMDSSVKFIYKTEAVK